jgi:hypothetical protein
MAQMQQSLEIVRPLVEVFAFVANPGDAWWAPTCWRSPKSRPARWGWGAGSAIRPALLGGSSSSCGR